MLHLIRYKNIIMIAVMMILIKLCAVDPVLSLYGLEPTFHWVDLAILALALCCVAAGGYAINDVYDIGTDSINRPETRIVGRTVSEQSARLMAHALSISGCILGLVVSMKVGFAPLALIFPFLVGLLWFYSSAYKGMFLIGNLVVAFMVGIVPLLPAIYELRGVLAFPPMVVEEQALNPFILLYTPAELAAFAFATTLIREIIKDMEDVEGDTAQGCNTMPIVIGYRGCKIVIISLIIATILGLNYVYLCMANELSTGIYFGLALVLPLIYLAWKVIKIETAAHCRLCSSIAKMIMLLGMCYLFVVWHTFAHYLEEW